MTAFGQFAGHLGLITVLIWVVGGYPLYLWGGQDLLLAGVAGCVICAVNTLAGGGIAIWAKGKDQKTFLKAVFGGMGIRLFIVLILFFIVMKLVKLHLFGLTLSLFLFYIVFQILEVRFFVGSQSGKSPVQEEI